MGVLRLVASSSPSSSSSFFWVCSPSSSSPSSSSSFPGVCSLPLARDGVPLCEEGAGGRRGGRCRREISFVLFLDFFFLRRCCCPRCGGCQERARVEGLLPLHDRQVLGEGLRGGGGGPEEEGEEG